MDLSNRQGNGGNDLTGMVWDELALVPVVTSTVIFTALEVYINNRCGAVEIELYSGSSKYALRSITDRFVYCDDVTTLVTPNIKHPNARQPVMTS